MPEKLTLAPGSTLVEISGNPLAVIAALDSKPSIGGYIINLPDHGYSLLLDILRHSTHKPVIYNLAIPDRCNLTAPYQPNRQLLKDCRDLGINGVMLQANCLPEPRALDHQLLETTLGFDLTPWIDLRMRGCVLTRSPFQALQSAFDHPEYHAMDLVIRPRNQGSMHSYLDFLRDYTKTGFRLYVDGTMGNQVRLSTTDLNAALGDRWHYIVPSRLLV